MNYETIVGLEVHAELNTKTKIYCGCENKFGGEVNTLCCPVCLGLPGALPVLNKSVVSYAMKMGLALGCKINKLSKQDRKHYFYPDLPKAYQISQYDLPLCVNGRLDFYSGDAKKSVGITRIHIEEDAGKLLHESKFEGSLVDFNRCGVPLIEIVSEPDLRSAAEAKDYLETIKSVLSSIDISDCKMQEGSIRCDINVSVRKKGDSKLGNRVEMKNVNSFSAAFRAIEYEAARQIGVLESGGVIEQETRRWDDDKGVNVTLRTKEDAQDYRYFPEPDICPIVISDEWIESIKKEIPELPNERIDRYIRDYNLPVYDANLLSQSLSKAEFFEECVKFAGAGLSKAVSNWILGDITKYLNENNCEISDTKLTPKEIAEVVKMVDKSVVSITGAKRIIEEMFISGKAAGIIVEELGLKQVSDEDSIRELAKEVLASNQKSVEDYKAGKTNAVGFLVGQAMKASGGKANPKMLNEIMKELLDKM